MVRKIKWCIVDTLRCICYVLGGEKMLKKIEVCIYCGTEISETFYCTGCGSSTGEYEVIEIVS